jgi:hypothetical protein
MIRSLLALFFCCALFAQDSALERLQRELKIAQEQETSEAQKAEEDRKKTGVWTEANKGHNAARMARVHSTLLSWIESRLPMGQSAIAIKSSDWEASMRRQLAAAGIGEKSSPDATTDPEPLPWDASGFDSVSVTLDWKAELPDMLFITAGVGVRCGEDQAVYGYRFDANGWAKVISDHLESDFGYGSVGLQLSDPDFQRRRLLLIHRWSVQCASTWMGMTYSVYRIGSSQPPESLLSSDHDFWLGNDGPEFLLKPDELMIEFLDRSIDVGVHNRTHLFRYSFATGVKRLDPVAFQPQDFAEEWLTAPWSEMQSRSKPETQKWHGKDLGGEYTSVVLCASKPDRWSIGLEQAYDGEKKLEVPIETYLLVRDLGNYRFEMEAVSGSAFAGCPGEGQPSDKHPWLSIEQLKALP